VNTTLKNGVLLVSLIALITFTFAVAVLSGKLVGTLREADATAHTTRETLEAATRIVDERTKAVLDTADRHLRVAREEVQATRKDLRAVVDQADRRLASLQADLRTTSDDVLRIASEELARANDSIAEVVKIRGDLHPVIESASATLFRVRQVADENLPCVVADPVTGEQRGNGSCWPAGFTAWLGGQKVLFGEAALTMRTVRREVPNFLAKFNEGIDTGNRIGSNVEVLTRDLTGRGHPISRILWWGAKVKQATPIP